MVDAAHRLHALRREADLVASDPVVAQAPSDVGFLNTISRREIRKTVKRMKILSLAMLRRDQFGRIYDAAGHPDFSSFECDPSAEDFLSDAGPRANLAPHTKDIDSEGATAAKSDRLDRQLSQRWRHHQTQLN
jgi:hypothetical protein